MNRIAVRTNIGFAVAAGVWLVLSILHFALPDQEWGQGRDSFFYLANRLTLASWLTGALLMVAAVLAVASGLIEQVRRRAAGLPAWPWYAAALALCVVSFFEFSRLPTRLEWVDLPSELAAVDWQQALLGPAHVLLVGLIALLVFGLWLTARTRVVKDSRFLSYQWWPLMLLALICHALPLDGWFGMSASKYALLSKTWLYLGVVALIAALGTYVAALARSDFAEPETSEDVAAAAPKLAGSRYACLLLGVGGTAFVIIFYEVILFQILMFTSDYLNANSALSIALLGITAGGLIGFAAGHYRPIAAMQCAAVILPLSLPLSIGAIVIHNDMPVLSSLLLMIPVVIGSVTITVALSVAPSHKVYFADLTGAGIAALVINGVVSRFLEENTIFLLAAFAAVVGILLMWLVPRRALTRMAMGALVLTAMGMGWLAHANLKRQEIHMTRAGYRDKYPRVEIIETRSSLVGRIDVIRRRPGDRFLKLYENGRIIDNLRDLKTEIYEIDPRFPHTLIDNPDTLIIGLSGEGITKSAKHLGNKVFGVEINPAVVDLMQNEMAEATARCYDDIDVKTMDGRSHLKLYERKYDYITLMNAHFARGNVTGRAPCPEYLHTREATLGYLDHLKDGGYLMVEEPVNRVLREPPVIKMISTFRDAMIASGIKDPARHMFCFQWKTRTNRYYQILIKKTPINPGDIGKFRQWLSDCNRIKEIEKEKGRRMGPIRPVVCSILYEPGGGYDNNFARAISGTLGENYRRFFNIVETTDNRPFPFFINTRRPLLKSAYGTTLLMMLPLVLLILGFAVRRRRELRSTLPYMFGAALTGLGYLLIEVVLMQKYEIYLGSPLVAFATVLGTLLIGSGMGSLYSGRLSWKGVTAAVAVIAAVTLGVLAAGPVLFDLTARVPLPVRILLAVGSLAPLAFAMGIPFACIIRMSKTRFTPPAAAMMFAINGVAGALAVPLTLNLTTVVGYYGAVTVGLLAYGCLALLVATLRRASMLPVANIVAVLLIAVIVAAPWLARGVTYDEIDREDDEYEVFAIEYGRSLFKRSRIVQGGSDARREIFGWYVWLIKGHGRLILVDTGFQDERLRKQFGIRSYAPVPERLAEIGIKPGDITDVVLTHMHWDHGGNLAPYTNATVWLQQAEYDWAGSRLSPENPESKGMILSHLQEIETLKAQNRLRLVGPEHTLVDGIDLRLGGAHTPGSQVVVVNSIDGNIVLAGDASYLYENTLYLRPIGTTVDPDENLATLQKLIRIAGTPSLVIPGHDPRVMTWFPEVAENVVRITLMKE